MTPRPRPPLVAWWHSRVLRHAVYYRARLVPVDRTTPPRPLPDRATPPRPLPGQVWRCATCGRGWLHAT